MDALDLWESKKTFREKYEDSKKNRVMCRDCYFENSGDCPINEKKGILKTAIISCTIGANKNTIFSVK